MEVLFVLFVLAGGLVVVYWFLTAAAVIGKSQKNILSSRVKLRQDQTSANPSSLNMGVYPGLYPGQIPPPDLGIPLTSIADTGTSGFTSPSGSDPGAMVSVPDTSSVISVADMGVVSGGDIGGGFGGDTGSASSTS